MKEVRPPKRPLIFYYCVAMLILLLFNFLAMPWMARQQIQEVDYGTFMDMAMLSPTTLPIRPSWSHCLSCREMGK